MKLVVGAFLVCSNLHEKVIVLMMLISLIHLRVGPVKVYQMGKKRSEIQVLVLNYIG